MDSFKWITRFLISLTTGFFALAALYSTFSKKPEEFYETVTDVDFSSSFMAILGWVVFLGKGLNKLYKTLYPEKYTIAIKITTLLLGMLFAIFAIGVWFIDSSILQDLVGGDFS